MEKMKFPCLAKGRLEWKAIRDIATAKLTGNVVTFKTNVSHLYDEHKIAHVKEEILTFDSRLDAENYFWLSTSELRRKG